MFDFHSQLIIRRPNSHILLLKIKTNKQTYKQTPCKEKFSYSLKSNIYILFITRSFVACFLRSPCRIREEEEQCKILAPRTSTEL